METIKQSNLIKETLDLREWWKHIKKDDVEHMINGKEKWKFWWFSDNKNRINTLENWKLKSYKTNETEILLNEKYEKAPKVKQKTKSEVLKDLFLSPDNQVKCTADAYERAKYSDKKIFWFKSKWKHNNAIIVLDFSEWKKPKISRYPLNKYNLKMKAVKI